MSTLELSLLNALLEKRLFYIVAL